MGISCLTNYDIQQLILSLILPKESYPSSKVLPLCRKSLLALWCCGGQIQVMRISTLADNFGLVRNSPALYLRCNFIYKALGIKAKCGWVYCGAWYATSSLVMTSIPAYWSRHKNRRQNLKHNRPCVQSRIEASIDPIVLYLPKSRILEFLIPKHTTKWRLCRLVPCLLPSS
jgi:hypothetical protein